MIMPDVLATIVVSAEEVIPAYGQQTYEQQFGQIGRTDQNYYRVFSLVNGGRQVEEDLFEGLR